MQIFADLIAEQRAAYAKDPKAAEQVLTAAAPPPPDLDQSKPPPGPPSRGRLSTCTSLWCGRRFAPSLSFSRDAAFSTLWRACMAMREQHVAAT